MAWLRALVGAVSAVAFIATTSQPASAKPPKRDRPLLFGGPVTKVKVKAPLDPRLPTGDQLPTTEPRPPVTASLCSFTRPVCVHAVGAAQEAALPASLSALENAYERVVLSLRLPSPLGDGGAGGTDALDWYLAAPPSEFAVVVAGRPQSAGTGRIVQGRRSVVGGSGRRAAMV
mgnify:CR=1 FL=1